MSVHVVLSIIVKAGKRRSQMEVSEKWSQLIYDWARQEDHTSMCSYAHHDNLIFLLDWDDAARETMCMYTKYNRDI